MKIEQPEALRLAEWFEGIRGRHDQTVLELCEAITKGKQHD